MKILNLVSVVMLAIAIFSTNSFAWSYARATDSIVQCAEAVIIEEYGKLQQPVNPYIYLNKVYKEVEGPAGNNYNRISFNVVNINISYPPAKGQGINMLFYIAAAETDEGVCFLVGCSMHEEEDLKDYITAAEEYMFLDEMNKKINNNR